MYRHFGRGWLRAVTSFRLVALWVRPEGESVTDNILSVTLILYIIRVHRLIHIPRDIILPVYMYLLYLLDGTVEAWMKSSVFIHLTQLPSNPIIFGFGRLALRCDFSKTKIQPLTYTLVIILNLFYFRFIYSILYILHTLIFRNTSSHFASQYRITQRYYLSLLEPLPLCRHRTSPQIDSLGHALVHIRVVQIRFIRIHPIYLYTYSSSLLIHSTDFGRVNLTLAHFRSSFLWCFIWFDSDLIGIVCISTVNIISEGDEIISSMSRMLDPPLTRIPFFLIGRGPFK